jgi:hypothetical protein
MRHLRLLLPISGVLLIAFTAVVAAVSGPVAAAGAALGVILVILSYTLTTVAVAWADSINPRLVFPVGMGMYIAKFSLLGVMMIAVAGTDWPGRIPMAVGIVLGVVAWTGTQIWWTVRTSRPIVPDRAP